MAGYLIRRILWAIVLLFVLSLCTFIIFFVLPGTGSRVSRGGLGEDAFAFSQALEVEGSLPEQYGQFIWNLLHGSMGYSYIREEAVSEAIVRGAPVTISLVVGGLLVAMLISFPLGVLSALRARSVFDKAVVTFVLIGISAHPIWLGLVALYLLSFKLPIFPLGGGYCDVFNPTLVCGGLVDWAYHLVLPWLVFALTFAAIYTRMIRASVLETLDEDYVRTARAKGASALGVLRGHVIRNALLPVVTMIAMDMGLAFAGSIYIESIFSLQGLGQLMITSIARRDLPMIMGIALWASFAIVIVNLLIDAIYSWIDPRIRLSTRARRDAVTGGAAAERPAPAPAAIGS